MRAVRFALAILIAVLVAGAVPAHADSNNIVVVDGGFFFDPEPINHLLPGEEVQRIERLITGTQRSFVLSEISPDDTTIVVADDERLGFLNIQNGSFSPINLEIFIESLIIPAPLIATEYRFGWRDSRTLASLALDFNAETVETTFGLALFDVVTQEISFRPITLPTNNFFVLNQSPDGSKAVFLLLPPLEDFFKPNRKPGLARVPISNHGAAMLHTALKLPAKLQGTIDRLSSKHAQLLTTLYTPDREAMQVTTIELDLVVIDLASGATSKLKTLNETSAFANARWSADSAKVAIPLWEIWNPNVPTRPRFDGALISDVFYRDVSGNMPPQDNPLFQNNELLVYDLGKSSGQSLKAAGGDGAYFWDSSFSTDGQTLMVQAFVPGRLKGRSYPIYGPQFAEAASWRFYDANLQPLGRLDLPPLSANSFSSNIAQAGRFVSPDEVIFQGVDGTNIHLYYYNRRSGEFRLVSDKAGTYAQPLATRRSRQLIYTYSSYTTPPELYRQNWDGTGTTALTNLNAELKQFANIKEYPVSFTLRNGQVRKGVLVMPAAAAYPPQNQPLVVWQEGGPGGAMSNLWVSQVERPYVLLPHFNYPLLIVPLAGRYGYGPQVYNALYDNSNFGTTDIDELAEIVNQAVAQGWTSRGRIGITGCSYGGYFTLQSTIRHPDLYAAANPQCALVDLFTEWTRGYQTLMPYIQGLPPWANTEEYRRDSPLYNADKIKTPMLTFQGTEDFLPITLGENVHNLIWNRGVAAKMVKFVGDGHGLSRDDYQIYAAQEQVIWFRTYLK
jgi:dipeptidyl aminopeptidase/acylaminoacyl peptidase